MLKCKQITELASKQLDKKLPWYQNLEINLHLKLCKTCNLYVKQIANIQKLATTMNKKCNHIILSSNAKTRILNKLNEHQKSGKQRTNK